MKRPLLLSGLVAAIITVSGCGSSKPEVPSWFRSGKKGDGKPSTAKTSPEAALSDLSAKVKQLDKKIAALDEAIGGLKSSKKNTVDVLRQKGITSSESLKKPEFRDDRRVKILVEKLERDALEEAKYRQLKEEFEVLQLDATNTQERLSRQMKLAKAGISDKELEQLEVQLRPIESRLKDENTTAVPVNPISAGSILDKEPKD